MYDERTGVRWDPTLTSQGRIEVMLQYAREEVQIRNFVETGTAGGETCLALHPYFDHLYTIEISPTAFSGARDRLNPYPHVECLLGDSTCLLPALLQRIQAPCLFWLDGHYCGSEEGRGPKDTPVAEELQIIFATGIPHVVLVDDARLFGRDPVYPSLEWVRHIATTQDIQYDFSYEDDIMRMVPR